MPHSEAFKIAVRYSEAIDSGNRDAKEQAKVDAEHYLKNQRSLLMMQNGSSSELEALQQAKQDIISAVKKADNNSGDISRKANAIFELAATNIIQEYTKGKADQTKSTETPITFRQKFEIKSIPGSPIQAKKDMGAAQQQSTDKHTRTATLEENPNAYALVLIQKYAEEQTDTIKTKAYDHLKQRVDRLVADSKTNPLYKPHTRKSAAIAVQSEITSFVNANDRSEENLAANREIFGPAVARIISEDMAQSTQTKLPAKSEHERART